MLAAQAGIDPNVASGSSGKLLEDADRKKLEQLYYERLEELEEAQRMNDLGRMEKLQMDIESILGEVTRATGLGGRKREKTDAEKVRKSVSMAVARDIKRIGRQHAALGLHLKDFIHPGYMFRYTPNEPVNWLT